MLALVATTRASPVSTGTAPGRRSAPSGADHPGRPQHVEQALAGRRRQALVDGSNRVAVVPGGPERLDELRAPGQVDRDEVGHLR